MLPLGPALNFFPENEIGLAGNDLIWNVDRFAGREGM